MSIDERDYMYDPKLFRRRHLSERETKRRTKAIRARLAMTPEEQEARNNAAAEQFQSYLPETSAQWVIATFALALIGFGAVIFTVHVLTG